MLHRGAARSPRAALQRMLELVHHDTRPEDPVAELERRIAELLGTQSALFFPSGTMAQQAVLRTYAERSGRRAFAAHPYTHLDNWEAQGYSAVHGLRFQRAGDRNALLSAAALDAVHEPVAAVVWELPQRDLGGLLPTWDDLVAQVAGAKARGAAAHLDGARLWEAQPFYRRPHAEIAGLFDSVYVSLYKGLLGVRGAVLAADTATIEEVGVWRQRLGGRIPDAWPLALAGLDGLDRWLPRMAEFRDHAVAIAAAVNAATAASTVPDPPLTPLFHVHLPAPPAAVERAGEELLADRDVRLFGYLRTSPDPARCSFEITVGDEATGFSPAEVAELIDELLARAAKHV
ncbi:aminotransferase class I/II-fold pyridoxal phosphate-dependent enzyme [Pseudonocardia aurantiaca]